MVRQAWPGEAQPPGPPRGRPRSCGISAEDEGLPSAAPVGHPGPPERGLRSERLFMRPQPGGGPTRGPLHRAPVSPAPPCFTSGSREATQDVFSNRSVADRHFLINRAFWKDRLDSENDMRTCSSHARQEAGLLPGGWEKRFSPQAAPWKAPVQRGAHRDHTPRAQTHAEN